MVKIHSTKFSNPTPHAMALLQKTNQLAREGFSIRQISEQLGLSLSSAYRYYYGIYYVNKGYNSFLRRNFVATHDERPNYTRVIFGASCTI